MNEERVKELFMQGYDCSQVVLSNFAEQLEIDRDTANRISACFGGGMMEGETCGAVTGALMAVGLKYGHFDTADMGQKGIMASKTAEFKAKFLAQYKSCICKELLGYDISKPKEMEKVSEEGLLLSFCPKLVKDVTKILENVL